MRSCGRGRPRPRSGKHNKRRFRRNESLCLTPKFYPTRRRPWLAGCPGRAGLQSCRQGAGQGSHRLPPDFTALRLLSPAPPSVTPQQIPAFHVLPELMPLARRKGQRQRRALVFRPGDIAGVASPTLANRRLHLDPQKPPVGPAAPGCPSGAKPRSTIPCRRERPARACRRKCTGGNCQFPQTRHPERSEIISESK